MHQVLKIEGLRTSFFSGKREVPAVEEVSLTLDKGKVLGIVGESGSGKSVMGLSIMRLIAPPGKIVNGRVNFQGVDLLQISESEMRSLRGNRIAMIFQEPMSSLNPVLRIDTQMIEAVLAHRPVSREEARERARDALGMVGIPSPDDRLKSYPHQFSGGMLQRVAIAIAMLHEPELIIADEPTTALDVTIQSQILSQVQRLVRDTGTSLIWITHDLSVVAGLADDISVMYSGRIVESSDVDAVLDRPMHPYTVGLLNSVPSRNTPGRPLHQIPGMTPAPGAILEGCRFFSRCPRCSAVCKTEPELAAWSEKHWARCHTPHLDAAVPK